VALRYRRMKKDDIEGCVASLLNHPVFGPIYGPNSGLVADAWRSSEGSDAFIALVIEEVIDTHVRILSPGVIVVVTDEFAQEMKTRPLFWNGPELAKRITSGRSPLLSNEELKRANSTSGINMVAWPSGPPVEDQGRMEVNHMIMGTFVEAVRGYRVKELFFQTPVAEQSAAVLQWGAEAITQDGLRTGLAFSEIMEMVKRPYEMVMNAELASSRFGSWASGLFVSHIPQFEFSRGEQRLLEVALRGSTDEELATELEISLSAVKKAWRSIYDRVDRNHAGILPSNSDESENGDRGKGKKHRLLAYVREHPEELRPFSMKLLRKSRPSDQADRATSAVAKTTRRRRVGRPLAVRH
jgi:hypothetical protein